MARSRGKPKLPHEQIPGDVRMCNIIQMMFTEIKTTYLRRQIALPTEHGSWVFILSPLFIGLFAGGGFSLASVYLIVAAMAAFLIRQPITTAIKVYSGRRSRRDLPAARFWIVLYGTAGLMSLAGLIREGYAYLLWLALPGIPVFTWHLALVSRRQERRQAGVEVVGSGVLALAAPAAYWVGVGAPGLSLQDPILYNLTIPGWWLFLFTWLQSAASIVYAYLRLEQRELASTPPLSARLRMARRAMLYTSFNLCLVLAYSLADLMPAWLPLPYVLQWAESIYGSLKPAVGYKPTRIGVRQLIISSLFTVLFILAWNFS